ncbi:MAG: hypothetical protein PHN88_09535 [Ignavibacteria bacterium]|nr:hypothetical protein [Ignavibacteria bacterium]
MYKAIIYIILLIGSIYFISCSEDNPAKIQDPIPGLDTVEYFNWKIDTFYYQITDVLPIDSTNYFMTFSALPYLKHYKQGTVSNIDLGYPYFRGGPIKAKNENKIYVGGLLYGNGDTRAQLRIVENGKVSSYSVPDDSTRNVGSMFIDKQDNLWLSTDKSPYKFSNGTFKKFNLGDSLIFCRFYEDNADQLLAFCVYNIGYPGIYEVKKIIGDTSATIYTERITSYGQKYYGVENICLNKDIVMSSFHTYFSFGNNTWNPFYSNNDLHFRPALNGTSRNYLISFLDFEYVNGHDNVGLIYDNGKLTYERKLAISYSEIPAKIIFVDEKTVFIPTVNPSRLFIGTKKQTK